MKRQSQERGVVGYSMPHFALRTPHSGFTLLEVLLALGLTVVTLGLISVSVNSTLKLVDAGREKTERDQLARAILTKIANDVRSTFRYQPFDASGMMSVNVPKSSKGGQSSSGGSVNGGSGNGGSGNGGSGNGGSGGSKGGGQSGGGNSSSNSSSNSSNS